MEGEPGPPGPPLLLPLTEKAYVVPLVSPVTTVGEFAGTIFLHSELQPDMSMKVLAVYHIQYSMPDCMFQLTVAVVSPTTTLTLLGADADEPPPQAAKNKAVTAATAKARKRFISMTGKMEALIVIVLSLGRSLFFVSGMKTSQLLDTWQTFFG
jgi:hypothetical protein